MDVIGSIPVGPTSWFIPSPWACRPGWRVFSCPQGLDCLVRIGSVTRTMMNQLAATSNPLLRLIRPQTAPGSRIIPSMALFTTRQKQTALVTVLCVFLVGGAMVWVWNNAAWVYLIAAALVGLLIWAAARKRRR